MITESRKLGWNIGNTLDAFGDENIGNASETAWGNPCVTRELIDAVCKEGFDIIRIPVTWKNHIGGAPEYKIEKAWLDRVKEVVDYAIDKNALVILNVHHEDWNHPYYDNREKACAIMEAVWTQIADAFCDYDEHLVFEGQNEPRKVGTPLEWNGGDEEGWEVVNILNQTFIDAVRSSAGYNTCRWLMIPGYGANCTVGIQHVKVPEDNHIIISVHAYEPYDFALSLSGRREWKKDTAAIDQLMKHIKELFIDKKIPVIIGEFGAMNRENEEERASWAEYYVGKAREIGVPCIWWDNGLFEGDGENFGLFNRDTNQCVYQKLMAALRKGAHASQYEIAYEKGIVNEGNCARIQACMAKARRGEPITVGFIGGSITQGSLSLTPKSCYAYRVYRWWQKQFPTSKITYRNAGIGGTTSHFGAARVQEDMMKYQPDFLVLEFSVNDANTDFFQETYEGLIRQTYGSDTAPAVLMLHNVQYNDGVNAQPKHLELGKYYDIPCISIKDSIYKAVENGQIDAENITPDDLHPNDTGHRLVAETVIYYLEKVMEGKMLPKEQQAVPKAMTDNAFEKAIRYQNQNSTPECQGFVQDETVQQNITQCFCNGWTASKQGDRIVFDVEGSGIAVQYRKSVKQPAPIAKATVDGDVENGVILDANFEETWGDCLYLQTLTTHKEAGHHKVEIELIETHAADAVPFYLVSLIAERRQQY